MFISITIQTYNRSILLAETLESLCALRRPDHIEHEILVVDNNSSDETLAVIERYRRILAPRFRSVLEPRQGLSNARNRALIEAKGEFVSFLDDDVKVDPGWLCAMAAAFARYSAAVVGGKSYLIYPSKRPSWLPECYESLLSRLDYGNQVIVGTNKDLFGLNLSVRKDLALQVGGFDPSLGRHGNTLRSGEEVDLLRKIRALGGVAVYEPAAIVGHIVSPERLRLKWFVSRVFIAGRESETLHRTEDNRGRVCGPVAHLLRCCGSVLRSLVRGEIQSSVLVGKMLAVVGALGRLYESSLRLRLPMTQK